MEILEQKLNQFEQKLNKMSYLKEHYERLSSEYKNTLKVQQQQFEDQIKDNCKLIDELVDEKEQYQQQLSEQYEETQNEKKNNEVLRDHINILMQKINQKDQDIKNYQKQLNEQNFCQKTVQEIYELNKVLREEKDQIQETKQDLEQKLEVLKVEKQTFQSKFDNLKTQYDIQIQNENVNQLNHNECSINNSPKKQTNQIKTSKKFQIQIMTQEPEGSPLDLKESEMKYFVDEYPLNDFELNIPNKLDFSSVTNILRNRKQNDYKMECKAMSKGSFADLEFLEERQNIKKSRSCAGNVCIIF